MENASKALIMAGGVLITIIVVSSLLYLYNMMTQYPAQQEEQLAIEQLAKFNAEYEVYQKQKMYGADVVTVINKALDNNAKYTDANGIYDIDVEITLQDDIEAYADKYDISASGRVQPSKITNSIITDEYGNKYSLGTILEGKRTYSLSNEGIAIESLLHGFKTKKINIDEEYPEFKYTMVHSGLGDFIEKNFRCTGINYSRETGRVNKLVFEEIKK